MESEQSNLLVDDTDAVLTHLTSKSIAEVEVSTPLLLGPTEVLSSPILIGSQRLCIDFICDNTGTELLLDLALADFLLRFSWAQEVTLHLKAHPTFVSDAVAQDIDLTITAIKNYPQVDLSPLADRLEKYRRQHRLNLQASLFWNSSRFFWEMPPSLQTRLAQAHLVIIKGDANYRRLLGDSRWPTTVPVADAIPYFPAPFVALRTMKSDPVVGLKPGLAEMLDKEDSEWRVNGKRGMIQALL